MIKFTAMLKVGGGNATKRRKDNRINSSQNAGGDKTATDA